MLNDYVSVAFFRGEQYVVDSYGNSSSVCFWVVSFLNGWLCSFFYLYFEKDVMNHPSHLWIVKNNQSYWDHNCIDNEVKDICRIYCWMSNYCSTAAIVATPKLCLCWLLLYNYNESKLKTL